LAEVTAMCDRIILVNRGRVVEERDLSELTDSLRRYWIRFRGASAAERACPFPVEAGADGYFTAQFDARKAHLSGLDWLRDHGGEIVDVGQSEASLESYFVEAVGGASA